MWMRTRKYFTLDFHTICCPISSSYFPGRGFLLLCLTVPDTYATEQPTALGQQASSSQAQNMEGSAIPSIFSQVLIVHLF